MKKRIIPIFICFICIGSLFFIPPPVHAQSDLPSAPNIIITPKYGTTDIGDKYRYEIDALSFENSIYGVGGMVLDIVLDFNKSTQLDKIIIPRFEGVSKQPQYGNDITVRVMAFKDNGATYAQIKELTFANDDGVTSMTVTREETLDYAGGILPSHIYIYFIPGDITRNSRIDSLYQSAPIICEFTTIDKQPLYDAADSYQRYYINLEYYDDEIFTNDSYKKISGSAFAYFNTSALTISADRTENLEPGDEIELSFSFINYSSYDNIYLYVGFQGDNIALLDSLARTEALLPNWKNINNLHYSAFHNGSSWIRLKAGETSSFRLKIKIDENFDGSSIDITAFDYHNYNAQKQFGNTITLKIKTTQNEAPPQTQDNATIGSLVLIVTLSLIAFSLSVVLKRKYISR